MKTTLCNIDNVVNAVNFIMNANATPEDIALYDMNNDDELNIGDIILIVKNILSQSNNGASSMSRRASAIADFAQYTAARFDVKVDKNASIKDIRLVGSMAQSHQLMYQQKDDNTYAVVVYSLSNQLMKPEKGCIVEVDTDGGDATMQNIIVATQSGETHYYQNNGTITGIYQLRNDSNSAVIFDLKGNRLNGKALEKGIYIVNGKKVIIK
jgi:TusA-related sulfurtransferase